MFLTIRASRNCGGRRSAKPRRAPRRRRKQSDSLCAEQESVLERLEAGRRPGDIGPKLAEEHDLAYWNAEAVKAGNLAPQLKIENEKEQPQTINYDELVKSWQSN